MSDVVAAVEHAARREVSRRRGSGNAPHRAFLGASAVVFAGSVALTAYWCVSMSAMGGMPMPGGWTMSMVWMPTPGRAGLGAAARFGVMWTVMMAAMMLPSLVPMLRRYREAVDRGPATHLGGLTALVGAGYFSVWAGLGLAVFPVGVALAALAMQQPAVARAVPIGVGAIVLVAGALQFTAWKAHHVACWRDERERGGPWPADAGTAWRHGVRLARRCSASCAGLMAVFLALGIMDLRAMAIVTAAVTAECLAPAGERVARAIGAVALGAGGLLIARAAGLG